MWERYYGYFCFKDKDSEVWGRLYIYSKSKYIEVRGEKIKSVIQNQDCLPQGPFCGWISASETILEF